MKRKAISKKLRFEVFKRDHFVCTYCGRKPPEIMLAVDHIVAVADGGSNEMDNLTSSCSECNLGKGARGLGSATPQIPEEVRLEAIQEAMERAATLDSQRQAAVNLRQAEGDVCDQVQRYWDECYGGGEQEYVPEWKSILQFLRLGLSVEDLMQAVQITSTKFSRCSYKTVRYFYGVCWTECRNRQGA